MNSALSIEVSTFDVQLPASLAAMTNVRRMEVVLLQTPADWN